MKNLKLFSWIVLINIFLVIIAGSVVRMSGAGMGCPDWPKCFGYWIPPTQEAQLQWQENKEYDKGQIIINEETLIEAKSDFTTGTNFEAQNWGEYSKHDYAIFNVYHTWTEYINRLFGALLGFFALIMVFFAVKYRKINKGFVVLALTQLFLIGFEAWLGKLTVDTNLDANIITYHMLGVTVMLIVQLLLLKLINRERIENVPVIEINKTWKYFALSGIVLMVIQIVLGTEVRQQTDLMTGAGVPRELMAQGFDLVFYFHRSFSFLIVFAVAYLYYKLKDKSRFRKPLYYLMAFIGMEILAGILLYYFEMPLFAQPLHLLLSLLIYGFFVEIYLRMNSRFYSV